MDPTQTRVVIVRALREVPESRSVRDRTIQLVIRHVKEHQSLLLERRDSTGQEVPLQLQFGQLWQRGVVPWDRARELILREGDFLQVLETGEGWQGAGDGVVPEANPGQEGDTAQEGIWERAVQLDSIEDEMNHVGVRAADSDPSALVPDARRPSPPPVQIVG